MPIFSYDATKRGGAITQGEIEASDRSAALRSLARQGLQPCRIESLSGSANAGKPSKDEAIAVSTEEVPAEGIRLSRSEVLRFTDEMADLLDAGVQLEPALNVMAGEHSGGGQYSVVVTKIAEGVREGAGFAQALRTASPSFGSLYCSLAEAGEAGGSLGAILTRQASHLKTLSELRSQVLSAMLYPAFLMVSGVALVALFVWFLVPKLEKLVTATGGELSFGARAIIGGSALLAQWWWLLMIVAVILVVAARILLQRPSAQLWWHRNSLRIPVMGPVLSAQFHVYFLETLSNLVGNGLPLLRGLELAGSATPNLFLRERLEGIAAEVSEGALLSRTMVRAEVFDRHAIDRVRIGEESGNLGRSLEKAAARSDRALSERITRIGELVQPAIILLMASLVGVIAYLMIGIIYDTITGLQ